MKKFCCPSFSQQGTIPTKDWELMLGAHEFRRTTRRSLEGEKKDKEVGARAGATALGRKSERTGGITKITT